MADWHTDTHQRRRRVYEELKVIGVPRKEREGIRKRMVVHDNLRTARAVVRFLMAAR